MTHTSKYSLGDMVYLSTDREQLQRIVTAITVRPTGVTYELSCGTNTSNHYDFELTQEENILLRIEKS